MYFTLLQKAYVENEENWELHPWNSNSREEFAETGECIRRSEQERKKSHSSRLVVRYNIYTYSKKCKNNHFNAVTTKYNFKEVLRLRGFRIGYY
jgi:hypothetical protein